MILFADVDGTLIDEQGALFPGVRSCIDDLSRNGWRVVLCSARPPWSLTRVGDMLGPSVVGVCALQGACIGHRTASGWVFSYIHWLTTAQVAELGDILGKAQIWAYDEESWFTYAMSDLTARESRLVGRLPTLLAIEDEPRPALKVLGLDANDQQRQLIASIPGLLSSTSNARYLECVSIKVGRDKGLTAYLSSCREIPARIVAIGDGLNDIGLLTAAGESFTFKDAPTLVRRVAGSLLSSDRSIAFGHLSSVLCASA